MASSVKLSLTTKSWCPPPHPNPDPHTAPLCPQFSAHFCESAYLPDHVTSSLASSPQQMAGQGSYLTSVSSLASWHAATTPSVTVDEGHGIFR